LSVVLGMITRDSLTALSRRGVPITLDTVLFSTLQVPYKSLILVDDSSDGTAEFIKGWAERHGKEVVVSRSRLYGHPHPTRATARQTAIDIFFENHGEEWLMFVDDDVVLKDGWWRWVEERRVLENPRVGEVWGINWDSTPERERFLRLFGIKLDEYLVRKFHERGGTHDTLYRRRALEGVRIPPELHVYEDAYLHHYVRCRGWESVVNPVGVLHYHPMGRTDVAREKEKMKVAIAAAVRYGIVEYETAKALRGALGPLAYLGLLRPVLGFPPMLLTCLRTYGFTDGFAEAVKRQYLKLWFRWYVLRNVRVLDGMPDVCGAILDEKTEERVAPTTPA